MMPVNEGKKSGIMISVGISNRHVHLSAGDRDILFGEGHRLSFLKSLSQKGQFAARETVTLVGLKGSIGNVRILGPERDNTQVEVSRTDMFRLGVNAPVRDSGDIEGTPGLILIGPEGMVELKKGVICAQRHIHADPREAGQLGLKDREEVMARAVNERGLIFDKVLIRIHESFTLELHLDTDEANAACVANSDRMEIFKGGIL